MKKEQFTFIDLFAGIWGFRIALQELWWKCLFSSEINTECAKIYASNFWEYPSWDITKIEPSIIPDHDIISAWFPCQPFSISWKMKWFEDTRWTLFFNILEIIKEKQPKVVFLENVKHLKDHNKKQTLKTIIQHLEELGYKTEWAVLNAKDFWLSQNRERIIIVWNKDYRFNFNNIQKKEERPISDILQMEANFDFLNPNEYTILPKQLWKKQRSWLIFCWYRNKSIRTIWVRPNTEHLSRVHKQPNRIYHIDGTHPTIPSQESAWRFFIYDWENVRKLTLLECFRLQWFPDNYIKSISSWVCYRQIWNSVAIPMIKEVAKEFLLQFNLTKNES